ncbi:hypothetical protein QC764_404815 [Podospora pseudoanserina]|uniref:Uncharacterized protein n=1 Tax=Podospora pseudoanserina TaxID=2609844 RepID=A0ABR0IBH9_9PEZI|nr:hypothetical protein QC764_404815 [Podospora pseudoanserina]
MAPYAISIDNRSDIKRSYALFAEPPTIKHNGGSAIKVVTRIISSARGVASPHGQANFTLSKKLYARCGVYDVEVDPSPDDQNRKRVGSGVEVIDQRLVTLGSTDKHGNIVPGTTLMIDSSSGTPAFTENNPAPSGAVGCFCIQTRGDFSVKEAKLNQFVVGFCSSTRQSIGPYATFVPQPSEEYQIAPSKGFYVVVGNFNPYDLADMRLKDSMSSCYVDFASLETDSVTLVHHSNGTLVRQVVTDGEMRPVPVPSPNPPVFARAFAREEFRVGTATVTARSSQDDGSSNSISGSSAGTSTPTWSVLS